MGTAEWFPMALGGLLPPGALATLASAAPGPAAGAAVNVAVFALGHRVLLAGLTPLGFVSGWVLGTTLFSAFGAGAYVLICFYFVAGSAVTRVKLAQKEAEGIAEKRSGRRSVESVLGSGTAGVACALLSLAGAGGSLLNWRLGFVASIASKLADTASSEIGKAYGRTTYLITSLERVPRGTEGAVSLEGTLGGMAAAGVMAGLALALRQVSLRGAALVVLAATVANLVESYIGATVQDRLPWLTNDLVNVVQISLAATLAVALGACLP